MFENVGKKIKSVAQWWFVIQCVVLAISGIVLLADSDEWLPTVLISWVAGPVVFWISSLMLYGFGEIVDTAIINRKEQKMTVSRPQSSVETLETQSVEEAGQYLRSQYANLKEDDTAACPKCGNKLYMNHSYCGKCGEFFEKTVF